jgi:hypothetical protein
MVMAVKKRAISRLSQLSFFLPSSENPEIEAKGELSKI